MNTDVLAELIADPDRLDKLSKEDVVNVVAELERLRAKALLQLSRSSAEATSKGSNAVESDRMLTVDKAAEVLGVTPRWLYDRSDDLPFARKLAPRTLRFSERGLYRWLETRP